MLYIIEIINNMSGILLSSSSTSQSTTPVTAWYLWNSVSSSALVLTIPNTAIQDDVTYISNSWSYWEGNNSSSTSIDMPTNAIRDDSDYISTNWQFWQIESSNNVELIRPSTAIEMS